LELAGQKVSSKPRPTKQKVEVMRPMNFIMRTYGEDASTGI
jgi:hypothetical protein